MGLGLAERGGGLSFGTHRCPPRGPPSRRRSPHPKSSAGSQLPAVLLQGRDPPCVPPHPGSGRCRTRASPPPAPQSRPALRLDGTGGAEGRGGRSPPAGGQGAVPGAGQGRDPPPNTPGLRAWSRRSRSAEPGVGGSPRCRSSVPWGRGCSGTHRTPHPTAAPPSHQPAVCECESWLRRAAQLRFVVALGSAVLAVPVRVVSPDPPPTPDPPPRCFPLQDPRLFVRSGVRLPHSGPTQRVGVAFLHALLLQSESSRPPPPRLGWEVRWGGAVGATHGAVGGDVQHCLFFTDLNLPLPPQSHPTPPVPPSPPSPPSAPPAAPRVGVCAVPHRGPRGGSHDHRAGEPRERIPNRGGPRPNGVVWRGGGGWGPRVSRHQRPPPSSLPPPRRHSRQSMYRACSFHIAEKFQSVLFFFNY